MANHQNAANQNRREMPVLIAGGLTVGGGVQKVGTSALAAVRNGQETSEENMAPTTKSLPIEYRALGESGPATNTMAAIGALHHHVVEPKNQLQ